MTPEAQKIAIAEVCGWRQQSSHFGGWEGIWTRGHEEHTTIPDYLNDLNAMDDAVKTLSPFLFGLYRDALAEVCTPMSQCKDEFDQMKRAIGASAARQAKAFLIATGKWKDTP